MVPPATVAELGGLAGWVLSVIDALGLAGVAVLVALENIFPPIPSEVVLPLAGFLSGTGRMSLPAVLAAATAGSLVGALVLYWAGARLGLARLERLAEEVPLTEGRDVTRAHEWFLQHGRRAVLFGRLVPGVRSLVSIPAGATRMPLPQFIVFTTIGSGVYNTALVLLGHQLGSRWTSVERYSDPINYAIYLLLAVLVAYLVLRRVRRRRRERQVTGTQTPQVPQR